MNSQSWRRFARWLLPAPVFIASFVIAYVALMFSLVLQRAFIYMTDVLKLRLPAGILVEFLSFVTLATILTIWIVPSALAIGFALRSQVNPRVQWGLSVALLLSSAYVWTVKPSGSSTAPHAMAVSAGAFILFGLIYSFRGTRLKHVHVLANALAFVALTVPYWIAFVLASPQPTDAQRLWSVVLDRDAWQGMNTGSSFGATRHVVVVGDRIVAVFDAGSAHYEGDQPMSNYRLVSLDAKTGTIKNSRAFVGRWGHMPYLFATNDGHVLLNHGSLKSLNPDLSEAGPNLTLDRGRANQISPDGSTLAWEVVPGTTLLDARTLTPLDIHIEESVPTSVSTRGVLTDNIYWHGQYPNDKEFVTLKDERGKHLLFHGDCAGRPQYLSDERVLLAGCDRVRILDLRGNILQEAKTFEGSPTFAGVSQNGKRFALQFVEVRGDPPGLLYEHIIIYDAETAQPLSMIRVVTLPEYHSWSAFSPDGNYFVAGSPNDLALYQLP